MYDFVSYLLRRYFDATAWNQHNSYLNLTASSAALLDFTIPSGLSLSFSAPPSSSFFTSYRLAALPNLRGAVGYIYSSTDNPLHLASSERHVNFKHIVQRFRITEAPRPPQPKQPTWLARQPLDQKRDYLVYGCMHLPSSRLDALYTVRISPTWQLLVTAVSTPPKYPLDALASSNSTAATATATATATAASTSSLGAAPPGSTNLQLTLQNDTGRWFTEYSYSADDALWGFRVLHNFGTPSSNGRGRGSSLAYSAGEVNDPSRSSHLSTPSTYPPSGAARTATPAAKRRINESSPASSSSSDESDQVVGRGLRGRFSAGAEVFVSTVEKSAGLSTGIRFATLPEPSSTSTSGGASGSGSSGGDGGGGGGPSQPPTVLMATLNPMMGHLSTAYAARMARDLVVCSRFDFNVYSYESELSIGGEYWLRASPTSAAAAAAAAVAAASRTPLSRSPASPTTTTTTTTTTGTPPTEGLPDLRPSTRAQKAIVEASTPSPSASASTHHFDQEPSTSLRDPPSAAVDDDTPTPYSLRDASPSAPSILPTTAAPPSSPAPASAIAAPITGVLKARISTTSDIRLLWQGRLRNCLVALGVRADLDGAGLAKGVASVGMRTPSAGQSGIVKSVGIEVMYFS